MGPHLNETAGREPPGPPGRDQGRPTRAAVLAQQRQVSKQTALPSRPRVGPKQPKERISKSTARANSNSANRTGPTRRLEIWNIPRNPGQPIFKFARDGQACNKPQFLILGQRNASITTDKDKPFKRTAEFCKSHILQGQLDSFPAQAPSPSCFIHKPSLLLASCHPLRHSGTFLLRIIDNKYFTLHNKGDQCLLSPAKYHLGTRRVGSTWLDQPTGAQTTLLTCAQALCREMDTRLLPSLHFSPTHLFLPQFTTATPQSRTFPTGVTTSAPLQLWSWPLVFRRLVPVDVLTPAPAQLFLPFLGNDDLRHMLAAKKSRTSPSPEHHSPTDHSPAVFVFDAPRALTPHVQSGSTLSARRRTRMRRIANRVADNFNSVPSPDDRLHGAPTAVQPLCRNITCPDPHQTLTGVPTAAAFSSRLHYPGRRPMLQPRMLPPPPMYPAGFARPHRPGPAGR
jgi:hypothetical protein